MSVLDAVESELKKYPKIKYIKNDDSIVIAPEEETGFEIIFFENENIVHFKGWHEHFSSVDEAINCIKFGLSSNCRLKEFSRGEHPYKWVVEYLENGDWIEDSETGMPTICFWKKKSIKTYKNDII